MTGAIAALVQVSGALAGVVDPLTVADAPTDVSGYGSSGAVANISTGLVVATPSGGVPPYTHLWSQVGVTPYAWTIISPTSATTYFTCGSLGPGNTSEAVFEDTVTDAVGATATARVTAFANNGQPYDNRFDRNLRTGEQIA